MVRVHCFIECSGLFIGVCLSIIFLGQCHIVMAYVSNLAIHKHNFPPTTIDPLLCAKVGLVYKVGILGCAESACSEIT